MKDWCLQECYFTTLHALKTNEKHFTSVTLSTLQALKTNEKHFTSILLSTLQL